MKRLAAFLTVLWFTAGCLAATERTVIFVCEKGSVKSVLAAALFNRLAREKDLDFVAVPRGTRAGEVVPAKMVESMKADGLVPGLGISQQVATAEAGAAVVVVAMCELPAEFGGVVRIESWPDIPPVTVDYAKARDALAQRIEKLSATLPAKP